MSLEKKNLRLKTPNVLVFPTDGIARRHRHSGFSVTAAIHVHPQHIFASFIIVNNLWSLHHAVRPQVAGRSARQECAHQSPLYEVGRGVTVDVGKRVAAALVFPNHVVCAIDDDESRAVGLEVFSVGLSFLVLSLFFSQAREGGRREKSSPSSMSLRAQPATKPSPHGTAPSQAQQTKCAF